MLRLSNLVRNQAIIRAVPMRSGPPGWTRPDPPPTARVPLQHEVKFWGFSFQMRNFFSPSRIEACQNLSWHNPKSTKVTPSSKLCLHSFMVLLIFSEEHLLSVCWCTWSTLQEYIICNEGKYCSLWWNYRNCWEKQS